MPPNPPDLFFFSLTPRFRVPKEGRLLCRVPLQSSINPNPFFTRRGFNHSLNLSPIFGKRLNRSSCRSYTNVSSTHQRVGMFFYRLRWTLVDCMSVGSDHPLGSAAYMSEASLKKGPAWGLSTTLDAGRLYELGFFDYARRWSIKCWSIWLR